MSVSGAYPTPSMLHPGAQLPPMQTSGCEHATAGFEHLPVVVSHVPATWQASDAVHETEFMPTHVPLWHESVCVHALPSLQAVPSATEGLEHTPLDGSQVPDA